jgi:hypothetical protein
MLYPRLFNLLMVALMWLNNEVGPETKFTRVNLASPPNRFLHVLIDKNKSTSDHRLFASKAPAVTGKIEIIKWRRHSAIPMTPVSIRLCDSAINVKKRSMLRPTYRAQEFTPCPRPNDTPTRPKIKRLTVNQPRRRVIVARQQPGVEILEPSLFNSSRPAIDCFSRRASLRAQEQASDTGTCSRHPSSSLE